MRTEPSPSPSEVTRRLLEASRLRDERRHRRAPPDMSPPAVSRRLRRVSELRDLCLALGRAREV